MTLYGMPSSLVATVASDLKLGVTKITSSTITGLKENPTENVSCMRIVV